MGASICGEEKNYFGAKVVKDEDPIKVFREALAEKERKLGKNDPQTLFAVFSLGALLRDKSGGSNDEAVKLFRRALVGFDRLGGYGPEHPHTKFIAESLGMLLKHMNKLGDAKQLLELQQPEFDQMTIDNFPKKKQEKYLEIIKKAAAHGHAQQG